MASHLTSRFGRSLRDYEQAAALNTRPELAADMAEQLEASRGLAEETIALRGPHFTLDQLIEQEDAYQLGLSLMEQKKWQEAEAAFRRSIDMGDCLPEPWGNIAGCYILQGRYDEAEAAFKRALEIEPYYDLARENLARLPEIREKGIESFNIGMRDPFKEAGVKPIITFVDQK